MPWSIVDDHPECTGEDGTYGVVKDADGSLVACHMSEEAAQRQVDALYANEGGKAMTVLNKTRSAEFKALTDEGAPEGSFSAVVAVYGNVDKVGDRIADSAFDSTLEHWRKSGDPIPIVLAHEWADPFAHIGYADPNKVKSVPGVGLVVEEGHLDIHDNPAAAQVFKLLQRRTLKEFSFGYSIPDGGQKKASDGAFDLNMVNLIEFGPCLKGVNDSTQLLAVKSALTGKETSLEDRVVALETLVKAFSPADESVDEDVEVKSDEDVETKFDEDAEVKSDDAEEMDIERQMATTVMDSSLSFMESSLGNSGILGKGYDAADEIERQLQDLENELK